nr:TolC family protein [Luteibacter sp. Sphag1AF]
MREAARATEAQINASLLWQEWQTVAKAQLLVVDISEGERLYAVQGRSLDWLDERAARLNHAIAAGDEERGAAAPALAAAADARTAHDDLQRTLQARHRELTALLGLRYDAVVSLAPLPPVVPSDDRVVRTQLATLAQRRPDLVALRLGYAAQEATLRAAVLAQFPALTLGYSASQDNSRVRNGGPAVTFDLPVFNHNQHAIAMASATRQQLHDEFAARIADAHDEVESLLAAQHTVLAQKARSDASPGTTDASSRAAFDAGLMDVRIYVDLVSASASRQAASITLEQTLREQIIALETLTGAGMPASLPPAGEHHE